MSCTVSPQALHISSVQARVFHVRLSSTSLRIRRGIRRVLRIHSYSSILYSPIHLAQPISVPIPPRGHHSRPISAERSVWPNHLPGFTIAEWGSIHDGSSGSTRRRARVQPRQLSSFRALEDPSTMHAPPQRLTCRRARKTVLRY